MNLIEESWAKLHAEIISLQDSIRAVRNTLNTAKLTSDEKIRLPAQLKYLFETYRRKLKDFNSFGDQRDPRLIYKLYMGDVEKMEYHDYHGDKSLNSFLERIETQFFLRMGKINLKSEVDGTAPHYIYAADFNNILKVVLLIRTALGKIRTLTTWNYVNLNIFLNKHRTIMKKLSTLKRGTDRDSFMNYFTGEYTAFRSQYGELIWQLRDTSPLHGFSYDDCDAQVLDSIYPPVVMPGLLSVNSKKNLRIFMNLYKTLDQTLNLKELLHFKEPRGRPEGSRSEKSDQLGELVQEEFKRQLDFVRNKKVHYVQLKKSELIRRTALALDISTRTVQRYLSDS